MNFQSDIFVFCVKILVRSFTDSINLPRKNKMLVLYSHAFPHFASFLQISIKVLVAKNDLVLFLSFFFHAASEGDVNDKERYEM